MNDGAASRKTDDKQVPAFSRVLILIGVLLAFALLVFWMGLSNIREDGPDNGNQRGALMKIEELGGIVPHDWWDEDYRWEALDITLGPEWTGGNKELTHLRGVHKVYELILDCPEIDDRGLAELGHARLEGITVKSTRITDIGLQHLCDTQGLQILQLDGSHITDAGLQAIGGHNLIWLMLEKDCRITDDGLKHLAGMTNLIRLELPGADLTGPGLAHLNRLTEIRSLVLRNSQIDDPSLRHLAALTRLQRLDLSGTRVTGPGLVRLKPLHNLEELYLDNTLLSDKDLQYLSELGQLVFVSLTGTQITKKGLEKLSNMPRLQTALLKEDTPEETPR